MKRTLITIAVTTVVVLSLVGAAFIAIGRVGYGVAATQAPAEFNRSLGIGGAAPDMMAVPAEAPAMPAPVMSTVSDSAQASENASALANVERKIIKNANLSIVVKDPIKSMDDITALADQLGGYVVSSNIYQSSYGPNNVTVPEGNISLRVPADKLNDALDQIKKSAVEVQSENISGQDVTDQYVDLQSRLAAKQAAEKKLLEIMQQASRSQDVLDIYKELEQVQSDIEVLKGQIKYIDQSAAMSSVSVTLVAEAGTQPIEIGGWKLQGTANEAIQNLISFTQGFTRFLIRFFLDYLWRILLIVLPLYLIFLGGRGMFRRFGKSKANVEVTEEEKK